MTSGVLAEILAAKRDEVTLLHQPATRDAIKQAALDAPDPRDFTGALRRPDGKLAVIAEIKRRSPSKGELAPDLDPADTARAYESGGAAALSVLTDRPFFGGSVDDLRAAREATGLPALRKDFTIDETQVLEARAIGADALLLIVTALPDDAVLRDLYDFAGDIGLAALVEVHDEAELERALRAGAATVGVNCRDLGTFAEDLAVAERLVGLLPPDVVAVAESAIRAPADGERMAAAGFDAVLVGEALVRSPDAPAAVRELAALSVTPRS
ncbi:MAG TPA: indole-3-glycerol phosphate synthase TrpC [Acidimicrobiia bacterium]|nr:indole-3-glycerol phosphate synthase TrpC [Acidimicrobiia bacterium]